MNIWLLFSWFWKKKCDQIFCLVRRKKAALVWRNPMGYARPSNSSIIDFLSQVYSRFAVRATMSLIFDLRKIGIKWNSVSFFSATQLEPQNTEKKKMAAKRTLWWKKPFFVTLLFFKSFFGFVKFTHKMQSALSAKTFVLHNKNFFPQKRIDF